MDNLLWGKLCIYIGTEGQVYSRRRHHLLNELFWNMKQSLQNVPRSYIISGSRAEGLSLDGSDIDLMIVEHALSVLPLSCSTSHQADVIMETEHLKPGFTLLRVTTNSQCLPANCRLSSDLVMAGNSYYLSSLLYRDSLLHIFRGVIPRAFQHGPCSTFVTVNTMELDLALCVHCKIWPEGASEWIQRHRPNNWPAGELIQDIVNTGCLLVPIGNPLSAWNHLEWRISFSLAEKKLVFSMNHTQILCYGLLKTFLKFIDQDEVCKGVLCSYFLKTCLFYSIEEDFVIWNESNIKNCLRKCFFRLLRYVSEGYCPNYFIKSNNMFEGKINRQNQGRLSECLIILCQNFIDTYISILCLPNAINVTQRGTLQEELELVTDVEVCGNAVQFNSASFIQLKSILDTLSIFENYNVTVPFDNLIFIKVICVLRLAISQKLFHHFVETVASNKKKYNLFKLIQNILYSCRGYDICTGLLHYATLCYNTGKFSTVIGVVNYVLSKFKPYTIYIGLLDIIGDKDAYVSEICGRGLTYQQKMTHAVARVYQVFIQSHAYAFDIETEVKLHSREGWTFNSPVVYSNVLLFLSHRQLGNTEMCRQSLNDLHTAVYSDRFVANSERPLAQALLNKCVELHSQ